jgi:methylated-DNA-[protein]-cysteine S-methyltransferase
LCRIALFPSALGWMGAEFRSRLLTRLTFGCDSPHAVLAALGGEDRRIGGLEAAGAELVRRLQAFAAGAQDDFLDVRLDVERLTRFQLAVVERCRRIPAGRFLTYAELASEAGYPRAARAAGNVMAANRFPLIVPCHRVIGTGGSLGGYSGPAGLAMKRRLLAREGALARIEQLAAARPRPLPPRSPDRRAETGGR